MSKLPILLLLLSTSAMARDLPYQNQGVVTAKSDNVNQVTILNQTYEIDRMTNLHGPVMGGELGPSLSIGDRIGFNMRLRDDTPYITDIWMLNDNH